MAKNILVATPQPAFGELLRLSLEESGRYRVRLVKTGRDALASAELNVFALAILDAALDEPPFSYVVNGLRIRWPGLRLLVIPPPPGQSLAPSVTIQPSDYLRPPLQAEKLLERVDELTAELPAGRGEAPGHDTSQIRQYLEEFLNDSLALEAMIVRARQPWVSAGQLSAEVLTETTHLLYHYAESNEGVDLARFVRLTSDGGEYLVYATPLPGAMVLALVYQPVVPLTVIRTHVARLGRRLRQPGILPIVPPAPPLEPPPTPVETIPVPPAAPAPESAPDDSPDLPVPFDDLTEADPQIETDTLRLVDFLAEMPAPNPENELFPSPDPGSDAGEEMFLFPWERDAARRALQIEVGATTEAELAGEKSETALPGEETPQKNDPDGLLSTPEPGQAPAPLPSPPLASPASPAVSPAPVQPSPAALPPDLEATRRLDLSNRAPTIATRPAPDDSSTAITQAIARPAPTPATEPTRPSPLYDWHPPANLITPAGKLAYTCVLVPRLPAHALVHPLEGQLLLWLPQLCLAYGWRMEGVLVQPEYLQWTVQVAPAISPGNVVRLVRQQTSRRIFEQLPQYEIDNPSGDFWAPGFLIISGLQPPTPALVHDFISQTRTRQNPWSR